MRLTIAAIGRMKSGPERELAGRYLDRLGKSAAVLGLAFAGVVELVESRAATAGERKLDEATRLRASLPEKAAILALDETGQMIGSEEFAGELVGWRDGGHRDLAIVIGGPDGLDPQLRRNAIMILALGRLTWPHQIVRILIAEQLYRATTIMAGHPYHRA